MNNYEKIMLALFAIQHNAYAFHNANEFLREYADSDFAKKRCEGRDKLMEDVVAKLAEVMEMLGEALPCALYAFSIDSVHGNAGLGYSTAPKFQGRELRVIDFNNLIF